MRIDEVTEDYEAQEKFYKDYIKPYFDIKHLRKPYLGSGSQIIINDKRGFPLFKIKWEQILRSPYNQNHGRWRVNLIITPGGNALTAETYRISERLPPDSLILETQFEFAGFLSKIISMLTSMPTSTIIVPFKAEIPRAIKRVISAEQDRLWRLLEIEAKRRIHSSYGPIDIVRKKIGYDQYLLLLSSVRQQVQDEVYAS